MTDPTRLSGNRAAGVFKPTVDVTLALANPDRQRAAAEGLRAAASILQEYAKGTTNRSDRKLAMELANKLGQRNPQEMMEGPRAYEVLFKGLTPAEVELFRRAEQYTVDMQITAFGSP